MRQSFSCQLADVNTMLSNIKCDDSNCIEQLYLSWSDISFDYDVVVIPCNHVKIDIVYSNRVAAIHFLTFK